MNTAPEHMLFFSNKPHTEFDDLDIGFLPYREYTVLHKYLIDQGASMLNFRSIHERSQMIPGRLLETSCATYLLVQPAGAAYVEDEKTLGYSKLILSTADENDLHSLVERIKADLK